MTHEVNKALSDIFLTQFDSPTQLKDWVFLFFGLDLPYGHIDADSNSSPVEWLWDAYSTIKNNQGNKKPVFTVVSSRDSYKTLSCSILEVLAIIHFGLSVAHMAAIRSQSSKSIEYINLFLRKIEPYLIYHKREITSKNVSNISIVDNKGNLAYISVVICTMAGANSSHVSLFCIDECDVVQNPAAFYESLMIPGMLNGRFPVTVLTSTRKYAFGLFQKELDKAQENGTPIKKWNILDVTEKCQPERYHPELPNQIRYIAKKLPLRQISEEEYFSLLKESRSEYDKIEAYYGCTTCDLLPVCKKRLSQRPESNTGGLYKPIDFTMGQFKKVSPDLAEAQLLCWKPSNTGLVYPRFDEGQNVITLEQAYFTYTGVIPKSQIQLIDLIELFHQKGISFYAGVDWGYRHNFAIVIGAILPNREFWLFENFAMSGLEFSDQLAYAIQFRDKYKPKRWMADTAMPSSIATFRKNKMPCANFKKDVMAGVESIRGQIVDANNRRNLKIIKTIENDWLIGMFRHHHFKLDAQGNPTIDVDDEEYSDTGDALRYLGQNLFGIKGNVRTGTDAGISEREAALKAQQRQLYANNPNIMHSQLLSEQINKLSQQMGGDSKGKANGVVWDMSDPLKD